MSLQGQSECRVVAVVQARMSSVRLPGKVLAPVLGRPMLSYLLDRLAHCESLQEVVLATSVDVSDDPLEAFATGYGIRCFRGSLDDVIGRIVSAAEMANADAVVRVCGDSPMMDPAIIDRAVFLYEDTKPDLVSNTVNRTFPKGQSVEVMTLDGLRKIARNSLSEDEREHVTKHYYNRAPQYRIVDFVAGTQMNSIQLSVDTPEDMARFEAIMRRLGEPYWSHRLEYLVGAAREIEEEQSWAV